MHCPRDQQVLRPEVGAVLPVQRCGRCAGAFLGPDAFHAALRSANPNLKEGAILSPLVFDEDGEILVCPYDHGHMRRAQSSEFECFVCPS